MSTYSTPQLYRADARNPALLRHRALREAAPLGDRPLVMDSSEVISPPRRPSRDHDAFAAGNVERWVCSPRRSSVQPTPARTPRVREPQLATIPGREVTHCLCRGLMRAVSTTSSHPPITVSKWADQGSTTSRASQLLSDSPPRSGTNCWP